MDTYDLTMCEAVGFERTRWGIRTLRLASSGFLIIGIVGDLAIFSEISSHPGSLMWGARGSFFVALTVGIQAYLVIAAVFLMSTFLHGGRGPTRLEVRDGGFVLTWERGSPMVWMWNSLRGKLTIEDVTEANLGYDAQLKLPWFRWAILSREACTAIVNSGVQHGLRVRTKDLQGGAYSTPSKRIIITRCLPGRSN